MNQPSVVGKYEIRSPIGQGGFATVYVAYESTLDREVALKIMAAHLGMDPGFKDRFLREARVSAALSHPSILPIYDAGEYEGQLFIAMGLLTGGSLSDRLEKRGALTPGHVIDILGPVADALDYAHSTGILHRDVKPGNIGFDRSDRPFLMDFGLARTIEQRSSSITQTGIIIGTPTYMAPEQAKDDGQVGPAADIYALGIVAYQMLTGQVPFTGSPVVMLVAHMQKAPPTPTSLKPSLPDTVDGVLLKVLAKKPEERYPTASSFMEALAVAVGIDPGVTSSTPAAVLPQKPAVAEVVIPRPITEVSVGIPRRSFADTIRGYWQRLSEGLSGGDEPEEPGTEPVQTPTPPSLTEPDAGAITIIEEYPESIAPPPDLPAPPVDVSPLPPPSVAMGIPSLVLEPNVQDLLAPVARNTIQDLLSDQEPEKWMRYVVRYGGGRFFVTGFGSFGGTSLSREFNRSLRRLLQKSFTIDESSLLTVRLNSVTNLEAEVEHFEAYIERPRGKSLHVGNYLLGNGSGSVRERTLTTILDELAEIFSGSSDKITGTEGLYAILEGEARPTYILLIVDKIVRPELLNMLLAHRLASMQGVTYFVVAEKENLHRWPDEVQQRLGTQWNFQIWTIPCLWESEYRFVERIMDLMFSGFLIETPDAEEQLSLFRYHLAYVGRGQVGTTLYELRQMRYWQIDEETLQSYIALNALDDDLVRQNAWVQTMLDENWDRILGRGFAGQERTDRAKLGVYTLMDWIISAATFSADEVLTAAENRPVLITDQKYHRNREGVVRRLLKVLVEYEFLDRVENSYDVIWGRDITDEGMTAARRHANKDRIRILEERLSALLADYEAANDQFNSELSNVARSRIERQIDDLQQDIDAVEEELEALR